MTLPAHDRTMRNIGLGLYLVGQLIGGALLVVLFGARIATEEGALAGMCIGAAFALPAGVVYLTVPRLLDRYDPEPWYALVGCFLWGAIAACGFSVLVNEIVGGAGGEAVAAVVSAPITEELWKGIGVAGVFFFLRREFDGVVDGIIYATFVALGFAMFENVIYYGKASQEGQLGMTFLMRGILFPWGHPVYTAMIGVGFGVARETERSWVRWTAPFFGYLGAVMLHAVWNGTATIAGEFEEGAALFLCMLPVWFLFVLAFVVVIVLLVRRRGRIIRAHLTDEVALGHLAQWEVDLTCKAFGVFQARMRWGRTGAEFVRAAARLALSKWHAGRAHRQQMHTVSMDFIVPLRERIRQLRAELHQGQTARR